MDPRPRHLLGPAFPDDTGEASPALAAALTAYAEGRGDRAEVLGALLEARLLVPVVAVLGEAEVGEDGLARDKSSDMAAVLLTGADGRLALLAFTGTASLAAWNPEARPVPVTTRNAAQAALAEGAEALVVDLAGPVRHVVQGEDLRAVAAGWRIARVGDDLVWVGAAEQDGRDEDGQDEDGQDENGAREA